MNVHVYFDELPIRLLNGLGLAYSNISHALQVQETPITFENCLSTYLITRPNCNFRFLQHRPPPLWQLPWLLCLALPHIVGQKTMADRTITDLNSHGPHLMPPHNIDLLHLPRSSIVGTSGMLLLASSSTNPGWA